MQMKVGRLKESAQNGALKAHQCKARGAFLRPLLKILGELGHPACAVACSSSLT
jgi:hypothetical protein